MVTVSLATTQMVLCGDHHLTGGEVSSVLSTTIARMPANDGGVCAESKEKAVEMNLQELIKVYSDTWLNMENDTTAAIETGDFHRTFEASPFGGQIHVRASNVENVGTVVHETVHAKFHDGLLLSPEDRSMAEGYAYFLENWCMGQLTGSV
jgi:hypothetical protein